MSRFVTVLLITLSLGAGLATAAPTKAEKALLQKVARVWTNYARRLASQGHKTEAASAVAAAQRAWPSFPGLDKVAASVEALPEAEAPDAASEQAAELARGSEAVRKAVAKHYDKLARVKHPATVATRFRGYLLTAAELDPTKARMFRVVSLIRQSAGKRQKVNETGLLLTRLWELDREGAHQKLLHKLEVELAQKDVVLVKAKDHPMVGYLSLPKGWKKSAALPVFVTVDGAGSNFLGSARRFARARGSRRFLVLAPCSLSNTNALNPKKYPFYTSEQLAEGEHNRIEWDLAGLAGLLDVLESRFGSGRKLGITGFSGGGNLCYAATVRHADRILFSAPACANFAGLGITPDLKAKGGGPPIHILTGAKDPHRQYTHGNKAMPGIEPQTDHAVQVLKELGFTNLRRTMLPGVGHSNCATQVWAFGDEVLKGKG